MQLRFNIYLSAKSAEDDVVLNPDVDSALRSITSWEQKGEDNPSKPGIFQSLPLNNVTAIPPLRIRNGREKHGKDMAWKLFINWNVVQFLYIDFKLHLGWIFLPAGTAEEVALIACVLPGNVSAPTDIDNSRQERSRSSTLPTGVYREKSANSNRSRLRHGTQQ